VTHPPSDDRPRLGGAASRPALARSWGAHHRPTRRDHGDFAIDGDPAALEAARRRIVDLPWVWLHQVHGADVVVVESGREDAVRGTDGDALVTADAGIVLAVQTADCVPVTFTSREGVIGVAHAGWRGLEAGVLEATADTMRSLGATWVRATVGPHIGAECYEFGADDLARLVRRFGPVAEGRTSSGRPSFDASAATHVALTDAAVDVVAPPAAAVKALGVRNGCTACDAEHWYSFRARGESARMATVTWRDAGDQNPTVAQT
jgi:YfiH family protein